MFIALLLLYWLIGKRILYNNMGTYKCIGAYKCTGGCTDVWTCMDLWGFLWIPLDI